MAKMTKNTKRTVIGSLIFSAIVLLATIAVMVFVPTERVWLELGALVAGLGVSIWFVRFGVPAQWQRWISAAIFLSFLAVWLVLGTAGYAWFGGFLAGAWIGVAWSRATKHLTVMLVRNEIISAIAEVRRVSHVERNEPRSFTTDYLDEQFAKAIDRRSLRDAAASALSLYGGWGSFSDTGTEKSTQAVDNLYKALRRGRSLFLRNS